MRSKRLSLRKEMLVELRTDELAAVAGGTTLNTCDICVDTLDGCPLTLNSCHPRFCSRTIETCINCPSADPTCF